MIYSSGYCGIKIEMKEKTMKEYKRRLRIILKSKLNGRNKITVINTWVVAIYRYGIKC